MRILILSCNTGEGHNAAARAIAEVLTARGIHSEITDALSFWSPRMSKLISDWHVRLYKRAPMLFNMGYRMAEYRATDPNDASMVYVVMSQGAGQLYAAIQEGRYDFVISTHAFASLIMRRVRKEYPHAPPHIFVATDYTCCPYAAESEADMYMIADERLTHLFTEAGVGPQSVLATGIPVRQAFFQPRNAAAARHDLGLPQDRQVVLLMCGSMGCGPMRRLAKNLTARIPANAILVAICGSNKKLYEDLTGLGPLPNLCVVGYTKQVPLYMDAADLILTKPGGLSSTEAAAKRLPMFFIDAVGGCEARNMEFFVGNGLAVTADSVEGLASLVCDALSHPQTLENMTNTLAMGCRHNGGMEICDYLQKSWEEKL